MATFRNPVIPGFAPDPSVCRVGDDYYLAVSSFEYFPGVPIWHSRDLVRWRQIGNVLDRPEQLALPPALHASGGVYAPTLRHHDGRFWLVTTVVGGAGTIIVTAEDPAGPWTDPVRLDIPSIDPDLAWDEDGRCWCTFAGVRTVPIDPVAGRLLGTPQRIWSGTGLQYPEGPHLYRIDGWWYLLLSEGGTERGHAVSIARGRTPRGPFEPCPANPILSHRSTDHPIQNTGHGDLVRARDGSWWMVLLGVRPRGRTPSFHGLGREVFLAPVRWEDGWPVVGPLELEQPAPPGVEGVDAAEGTDASDGFDDFDEPRLRPWWVSVRERPAGAVRLDERPGHLVLHARGTTLDRPGAVLVGRRQRHPDTSARTRVDAAEGRGGLTIRLDEAHHYEVEADGGEILARARIGPLSQEWARHPAPADPVLRIDVRTDPVPADAPDAVVLGYQDGPDGAFVPLAELDGRYLSTEVASGFTGRVIGMYATRGTVAFDWFDLRP
ncbi:glycoside hydrolase family 43 protein [Streptomyces sp. 6N223]|uniref:glycoside hydrolase family 43 protein n=1 Tax=Streptomyces sp. 6N223 TaxID=3457412 RepID=UPI003FD66989